MLSNGFVGVLSSSVNGVRSLMSTDHYAEG